MICNWIKDAFPALLGAIVGGTVTLIATSIQNKSREKSESTNRKLDFIIQRITLLNKAKINIGALMKFDKDAFKLDDSENWRMKLKEILEKHSDTFSIIFNEILNVSPFVKNINEDEIYEEFYKFAYCDIDRDLDKHSASCDGEIYLEGISSFIRESQKKISEETQRLMNEYEKISK